VEARGVCFMYISPQREKGRERREAVGQLLSMAFVTMPTTDSL